MFTISRWAAVPSWGLETAERAARRFALPRDAVLRVDAFGRDVVLCCEEGTILVTRAGDAEDHVLEAGQRLPVRRREAGVAWALTEARLVVDAAEQARPFVARWLRGLGRRAEGPALLVAWLALAAAFVFTVG